jgi:hypothetical protein
MVTRASTRASSSAAAAAAQRQQQQRPPLLGRQGQLLLLGVLGFAGVSVCVGAVCVCV